MNQKLKNKINIAKEKNGIYFIAEIGQNHQGSLDIAKKMVDSLKNTGVYAIKTAKRDIDQCLSEEQKNMIYDNPNSFGKTYYEHRKALELEKDEFIELKNYIEDNGFDFIPSFTDSNSLDFLNEIGVKYLKIASQRMKDVNLLKFASETNKSIILSSGMSEIDDINKAINIFKNNEKYLLQCTSSYPCEEKDINLNVINTYKELYRNKLDGIGFSGHHTGIAPDLGAYMLGIDIIERHYTLHRYWKGSDHAASLELDGIKYIFKYIKQIKNAMGSYKKKILDCELPALKKLRG
jgi:sialic acid synthase SpsE